VGESASVSPIHWCILAYGFGCGTYINKQQTRRASCLQEKKKNQHTLIATTVATQWKKMTAISTIGIVTFVAVVAMRTTHARWKSNIKKMKTTV
jgi:hypothetical protein